ncbi:uncharacterized protein [Centroberyx affinis]|uniref:uncharacterized protein isoform X1 n=1 Tax=Centroberyx affinis TaxID=166261 RepID=UPI003A5B94D9
MDLSLLPTPVSEYNKQRTGARFTVRSANSPSYSLNRRLGLRRPRAPPEEERENIVEVTERGIRREDKQVPLLTQRQTGTNKARTVTGNPARAGNHSGVSGQCEEKGTSDHKTSGQLNQNGTIGKAMTESGSDRRGSCNPASESRGRTEWRRLNLPNRSKSLDWGGGASSPDQGTKAGILAFTSKQGGVIHKRAESLEKKRGDRDRVEGTESRVMSTVKAYNSAGTGNVVGERSPVDERPKGYVGLGLRHMGQTLERAGKVQSLPSRLKLQAGSDSGFGLRETASSFGPKGGQSILERIEKLYGSAGSGKTEDSTRIKDLSSPVRDRPLSEGEGHATVTPRRRSTPVSPVSPPVSQWRRVSYEGDAGGTFPRRFSKGEKNSQSPLQSSKTSTCTPHTDTNTSVNPASSASSGSPGTTWTRESAPGGQWQGQIQGSYPVEGGVQWGRGLLETGTRSLDRARSKNTVAAQIRSARAAGGIISAHPQPQTSLEKESSASFRDPSGSREGRSSGSKDKDRANSEEEKGGIDEINEKARERIGHSALKMEEVKEQEKEKGADDRAKDVKGKEEKGMKRSSITEDVFESSSQKISVKSIERKTFPEKMVAPSAANVRNKIHQFEALTQRVQGSATGQFLMPRRTFSVPEHSSGVHDGVKKSGSERAIGRLRERWGGEAGNKAGSDRALRGEIQEEDKKAQRGSNLRSLSVDEVGLGLGNRERRGGDLVEREGKEDVAGGNNMEHFGKYSRLKDTLEIPLNGGAKRQRKNFYIDETDFCKATSPEKSNKRDITSDDTPSSLLPNSNDTSIGLLCTPELSGVQKTALSGIPSPVSDEDKTPTNPPNNSPFLSHHSLPENTAATAGREDESTPVFTPTAKTPGRDSPDLPVPLATSSHSSLPDLVPPDVTIPDPKGEKRGENLDAWIASWNPKIKGWNDDEDDDDDDDDDDEGTEKDEDSNYDSDSGDSSVTITSNMSQSDRRSFCVSLADLCNFGGVDYESENDSDEWPSGRRSASLSSDISALSCVSVMPNEELDRLLEDVRGLGDNTLQDYDDVQVVVLHKEVGVGLGFSVAGGVDQNKPTTVHKVFPSGVAAQEGSIREGDQVLSINGTALCGSAHWEALRILRRARTRGMGVVVLRRGGVSSASKGRVETDTQGRTQTQSTETGHRVCVKLEKLSRDLGFSLEGGVGSRLGDRPLSIQKIFQGGPVSKVCPGDEVLEIEGVSVVGMRRLEAWTLIRRLPPGPVDVVLHRPLKHLDK